MSQYDNIPLFTRNGTPRALASPLPALPARHIARPRLVQRLLAGQQRLNLLQAPAGFGKSLLLNECAHQAGPGVQVVWLALRGQTLTPDELLGHLASALGREPRAGDARDALEALLNSHGQPLWIVLDDYPRQHTPALDQCLGDLLERDIPALRWWIASRRRPDWNLPRLLLQGDLLELDAAALALDAEELARLAQQQQTPLAADCLTALLESSGGWPAMLSLALRASSPPALESAAPVLQDYLRREILAPLPAPLRQALAILAQLPRCNAELCQHLRSVGRTAFEQLRQMQLLRRLAGDGDWYRPWPVLARLLCDMPDTPAPLHSFLEASQWFAAHGKVREAVQQALAAGHAELAVSLLRGYGQDQMMIEQSAAHLLQWRERLPPGTLQARPHLVLLHTWALIICARLDEAQDCLQDLARFLPAADAQRQRRYLAQYQATLGVLQRQFGLVSARRHCLDALDDLDESAWAQHILCHQALAQQAMAEGDLSGARQHCQNGLRLARQQHNLRFEALLSVEHIHLLALCGNHGHALDYAEQMLSDLDDAGQRGPMTARLRLLRGTLLAARGDAAAAMDCLRQGLDEAEDCQDAYLLFGYQALIACALDRGETENAHRLLLNAERRMQQLQTTEIRYRDVLQLARGELWLAEDEAQKARDDIHAVLLRLQDNVLLAPTGFYDLLPRARLLLARAHLALGDSAKAGYELQGLLEDCHYLGLRGLACECQLELAEALYLQGQQSLAETPLRDAIDDCRHLALRQPLLAMARRGSPWIQRFLPGPPSTAPAEPPRGSNDAPPMEVLSLRELEVLDLIAQGYSNQQIAERLAISLHTVKTHARRINIKLEVERRTQAVARAKSLGLLR